MKKLYILLTFIFLLPIIALGQQAGDYKAIADGYWGNASIWQRFDGSNWVAASVSPGKASSHGEVTIAGYTVRLNSDVEYIFSKLIIKEGEGNSKIGALVVESSAQLLAKEIVVQDRGAIRWRYTNVTLDLHKDVNLIIESGGNLAGNGDGGCVSSKALSIGGELYAACTGSAVTFQDVIDAGGVNYSPKLTITNINTNSYNAVGDVVTYEITVSNEGLSDLEDITAVDPKTGLDETLSLAAGESRTYTLTYTVVQADVDAGYIKNTASAVYGSVEVTSTNGKEIKFRVFPVELVVNTTDCQWGYNYEVKLAYDIVSTETMYTFQGELVCPEGNGYFDMPETTSRGYTQTNAGYARNQSDCATATIDDIGCQVVDIQLYGNGIPEQKVTFNMLENDYYNVVDADNTVYMGAEENNPPEITINNNNGMLHCVDGQTTIVSQNSVSITDPEDGENGQLEQVFIQISENYKDGDLLSYDNTVTGITSSWSETEGKLTLTGPASFNEFEDAIESVYYTSSNPDISDDIRSISIVLNELNFLASTGHYYEYVPSVGIKWTEAKAIAETRYFYGIQGYLATITSEEEAALLGEQAEGAGWIGGSDAEIEGEWRWMTGPEAGQQFWQGGTPAQGGTVYSGAYANWNNAEPNNQNNEDYAHITYNVGPIGSWNDLPDAGTSGNYEPKGYLVEYGWTDGTDEFPKIAATTTITPFIAQTHPVDQTAFAGDEATFVVTTRAADSYQWQVSLDGGDTFTDISATDDNYQDINTPGLKVVNIDKDKEGHMYRMIMQKEECSYTSDAATLFVKIRTVITNRNQTYRVNKS
ncbi:DUF7507 domain-containing protein [Joostella sp. CR20]|uniref:DUF7507 domain-containing protein n=1 Tax=Joostella sp. CR20 TaxID=2804312 RepID=UPI00313B0BBE